jgi:aspartate dehydrogenase
MRFGLIGYGAIADTVLRGMSRAGASFSTIICLTRPNAQHRAQALLDRYEVAAQHVIVSTIHEFVACGLDVAVECASKEALIEAAEPVLRAGVDLLPVSLGAFAEEEFHQTALRAAAASGAKLYLPSGAIGGLDILGAARLSGINHLLYVGRKPPVAWMGTPADNECDLDQLSEERVIFEGTARDAVRQYPKNANVAAAIALAGIGFDDTRVRLLADPAIACNVHELIFRSACANVALRIEGLPAERNPKTSLTTGYSVARLILNRLASEVF